MFSDIPGLELWPSFSSSSYWPPVCRSQLAPALGLPAQVPFNGRPHHRPLHHVSHQKLQSRTQLCLLLTHAHPRAGTIRIMAAVRCDFGDQQQLSVFTAAQKYAQGLHRSQIQIRQLHCMHLHLRSRLLRARRHHLLQPAPSLRWSLLCGILRVGSELALGARVGWSSSSNLI